MMKRRLLIIEDDSIFCQTMQDHMQGENIEVCFGKSLANALEFILEQEYCLLIAAIQPTKSEDIEMLRVIRKYWSSFVGAFFFLGILHHLIYILSCVKCHLQTPKRRIKTNDFCTEEM